MCENLTVRRAIKQGSGIPTIPVSTSHQNGDWLPTDIYVGEQYLDTDTGIVYTRNGNDIETVGGGAGNKLVWKGLISQSVADAPTAIVLENTLGGTITFARTSKGIYTATLTGAFTADKTFLIANAISPSCIFSVNWTDVNTIALVSLDGALLPEDSLLNKVALTIEIYP